MQGWQGPVVGSWSCPREACTLGSRSPSPMAEDLPHCALNAETESVQGMGAFLSAPPVLATDRALGGWQPSGAVCVLPHRHSLPCLCRNSSICFSGWAEWQLVRFACLPLVRASLLAISAQTGDLWRHQINMSASLPQEATLCGGGGLLAWRNRFSSLLLLASQ